MTSFYGPGADQIGLSAVQVKDPYSATFWIRIRIYCKVFESTIRFRTRPDEVMP